MLGNKITMVDRVFSYIKEEGEITTWEAIRELGCTRLSEYIRQLRSSGNNIQDEWVTSTNRYGDTVKFKRYIYSED